MNANVQRFDKKAERWDANPRWGALTESIVRLVEAEITGLGAPCLMDYGCGTGLCSLALAPRCSSVVAVDISPGMLAKVKEKTDALSLSHVRLLQHDLTERPLAGYKFDVIVCAMTLHHIRDISLLFQRFRPLLAPYGVLAIADLDREDGSFHTDPTGVEHHGFDRNRVLDALWNAGFTLVKVDSASDAEKASALGEIRRYPVFFMAARVRPKQSR